MFLFKDIKEFVIDRNEWARGIKSKLLFDDRVDNQDLIEKKCCLGFYSLACGLNKKEIKNTGCPSGITNVVWNTFLLIDHSKNIPWMEDSEVGKQLMIINDDPDLSDSVREEKIISIFGLHGIKVTFIN